MEQGEQYLNLIKMQKPKIGDVYITPENTGWRILDILPKWLRARPADGGVAKNFRRSHVKNWIKILDGHENI